MHTKIIIESHWIKSIVLVLFLSILTMLPSLAQEELDSFFTVDTAAAKQYPFDIEFPLNLIGKKGVPIQHVYIFQLNAAGYVVPKKNTSFLKQKWVETSSLKKYKKQIEINKSDLNKLEDRLEREEKYLLGLEVAQERIEQIQPQQKKNEELRRNEEAQEVSRKSIEQYNSKLDEFLKKEPFQAYGKLQRIKQIKIIKRSGDTVRVKVPKLRPGKEYLVFATNDKNKISDLKSLAKKYYRDGALGTISLDLIPKELLSKRHQLKVLVNYYPNYDLNKEFKSRRKPLERLLTEADNFKPLLIGDEIDIGLGDDFSYPFCESCLQDSVMAQLLKEYQDEFWLINGTITNLRQYGEQILKCEFKLELNAEKRVEIEFMPGDAGKVALFDHHLKYFDRVQQSLLVLSKVLGAEISTLIDTLDYVQSILKRNREQINAKVKLENSIARNLSSIEIKTRINYDLVSNSTKSYTFYARNSRFIKGDFGLAYFFSNGFNGFVPWVGFRFNPRPTNENVPFYAIPGWQKFVTIQVAVPVFTDDLIDENRRKHLLGDEFSLYGGIGINLSHSLRLSYGAILFQEVSGSTIGNRDFKLASVHAFTVGLDIRLNKLFNGVNTTFGKLTGK